MDAVARPEGVLTVHGEGSKVELRVDGVLVWHGSLGAWSRAVANPKKLTAPVPQPPKVA